MNDIKCGSQILMTDAKSCKECGGELNMNDKKNLKTKLTSNNKLELIVILVTLCGAIMFFILLSVFQERQVQKNQEIIDRFIGTWDNAETLGESLVFGEIFVNADQGEGVLERLVDGSYKDDGYYTVYPQKQEIDIWGLQGDTTLWGEYNYKFIDNNTLILENLKSEDGISKLVLKRNSKSNAGFKVDEEDTLNYEEYISEEENIIGSWRMITVDGKETDMDYTLTFFENGSVIAEDNGSSYEGNYTFSDGKIKISSSAGFYDENYVCDYEINDGILIIYNFGSEISEFLRE